MSKNYRLILVVLLAPIIMYYLWTRGVIYFNYSSEVYSEYFWYRAPWLLVHVICGILATLIGPFQFIPAIRAKRPLLHRNLGKAYLTCIVISTFVSFYLVSTSRLGIVYDAGLTMLGIAWLGSSMMGYLAVRKRDLRIHKEWMIKSYVLTLSFVLFRFIEDLLAKADIGGFFERKTLMSWACWAIPLLITDVILQLKKLYSKSTVKSTETALL